MGGAGKLIYMKEKNQTEYVWSGHCGAALIGLSGGSSEVPVALECGV